MSLPVAHNSKATSMTSFDFSETLRRWEESVANSVAELRRRFPALSHEEAHATVTKRLPHPARLRSTADRPARRRIFGSVDAASGASDGKEAGF